ncbi:MAG: hypothetical protein CMM07_06735 [Rhodopirellula sp.]|nr:hypothetical protein [Rhodopirellula sp.]
MIHDIYKFLPDVRINDSSVRNTDGKGHFSITLLFGWLMTRHCSAGTRESILATKCELTQKGAALLLCQ